MKKYYEENQTGEVETFNMISFKTEKARNDKKRQHRAARDRKRQGC